MKPLDLTVVMYHYVRDVRNSAFPALKALSIDEFDFQLDYLEKNHNIVSWDDLKKFLLDGRTLPEQPCLLTFDDGICDCYDTVFPRLRKRGLSGLFFVIARKSAEGLKLAHLLHFLIAKFGDAKFQDMFLAALPLEERKHFEALVMNSIKGDPPDAFGEPELRAWKRVIQRDMPEKVFPVVESLFRERIGDPVAFAESLYLSDNQMAGMAGEGMHFGGHGSSHHWLACIPEDQARIEIEESARFLKKIQKGPWAFGYPYGDYNSNLFPILKENNFIAAVTVKEHTRHSNPYEIHRVDTASLPRTQAH